MPQNWSQNNSGQIVILSDYRMAKRSLGTQRVLVISDLPLESSTVPTQPLPNMKVIHSLEYPYCLEEPEAVVIELPLVGADPIALTRNIRTELNIPVLFLTAHESASESNFLKTAYQAGLCDFLYRPTTHDFIAALEVLLKLKNQQI